MNRSFLLFSLFLFFSTLLSAQPLERFSFSVKDDNGTTLDYALAGGLNSPQFSEVDLNNDGIQDLYIFDRAGYVGLTFINEGTPGEVDYRYRPEYEAYFPRSKGWVALRDYNGDGVMDIFASANIIAIEGIVVYTGKIVDGHIAFDRFQFTAFEFNVIPEATSGGNFTNLYVSKEDYPAFDDMDGDGDLDILTFALGGGHVNYYTNQSQEMGYGMDSLIFNLEDDCWGRFYESGINEVIDLSVNVNECVNGLLGEDGTAQRRHAGSTLLTFDNDADGDKELLVGDLSFTNLNLLTNGGDNDVAFITEQDTFFPSYNFSADVIIYPASFYLDVNNDGVKDLLGSPNVNKNGENHEVVWHYNNLGANNQPQFQFLQKDFLVGDMIDIGSDSHPTFVDYNADGLLDLVIGNLTFFEPFGNKKPRIHLYENVGTSTNPQFQLVDDDYLDFSNFDNSANYGPTPTFGDLDNDGDLDVLIGETGGSFFYAENIAGAGNPMQFGNIQPDYMDIDLGQHSVPSIVDLNRDGKPDLVVGEKQGTIAYFPNQGTAEEPFFVPNPSTTQAAPENTLFLGQIDVREITPGTGYATPAIIDFNGEFAIFTGSESGQIFYHSNIDGNLEGAFTQETDFFGDVYPGFHSHPAFADLNGDSVLEMVVGNRRGGLSAYQTPFNTDGTNPTQYVYQEVELSLYPNPASDYITLELINHRGTRVNLNLFNAIGQHVKTETFTTSTHEIDIQDLAPGVYFCRIEIGSQSVLRKVLIH